MVLALSAGVPQIGLVNALPDGWPVSWLRSVLALPAWAAPTPTPPLPAQSSGTANGATADAATGDTKDSDGVASGTEPGKGIGALDAEDAKRPATGPAQTGPAADSEHYDPATSKRIVSAATEKSDVYVNTDGSYTRKVAQEAINYQAADGSWQPIDTTLTKAVDGRLKAGANSIATDFAARADDGNLAAVRTVDGGQVSYSLQGAAATTAATSGSTVTYPDVLANTDLVLSSESTGLKEEVILRSPGGPTSWVFPLKTNGLTPRLAANGSVELVDATGQVDAIVPHGNMHDSYFEPGSGNYAQSRAVTYELVTVATGTALKVSADPTWLADPARVYPVTIDPSIVVNTWPNNSTYVQTGISEANDYGSELRAGTWDSGAHVARSFLKYDWFGSTYNGARINSAQLQIFNVYAYTCTPHPIAVRAVNQAWDPSTTAWPGPTLGNQLGTSTENPGAACGNNNPINYNVGTWLHVPLDPALFTSWALGGTNNGLAVVASESISEHWKKFCSSRCTNAPMLTVDYTPNEAPQVNQQYPGFGYSAPTLTPQLLLAATDPDNWPSALSYNFQVYDKDANKIVESGPVAQASWVVPAGKLRWGQSYSWTAVAWDGSQGSTSQTINLFTTGVPQPAVTSGLSQNGGQGFEPNAGNYTTTATEALVATIGPPLAVQRAYNSLDPRTTSAFGTGWSSLADMTASVATSGSGAADLVAIRYPTGQEIAFGLNPDGTFAPPQGRFASLTAVPGGGYRLVDKDGTTYLFTLAAGTGTGGSPRSPTRPGGPRPWRTTPPVNWSPPPPPRGGPCA